MVDDFILTFLGTGTSTGVPVIGCSCETCLSSDFRDKRTRASIHLQIPEWSLLIDSGPDLREQALREKLSRVDSVLYTHGHLDHVTGFDDLRAFCWHREAPLPLYATGSCMQILRTMFGWAFSPENTHKGYIKPDPHLISQVFQIGELEITPLPVEHAAVETIGFLFRHPRMKSLAYLPDVKRIPEPTYQLLEDIEHLVVDALGPFDHPTHFSNEEALAAIERIQPAQAWLTHLSHKNGHGWLESTLPSGIQAAHDGLKLNLAVLA